MRVNLVHEGADELNYEIRQIAELGRALEAAGVPMIWENIGDPVAKGEEPPMWIRQAVADVVLNDVSSFGYSPTKGLVKTRQFLAQQRQDDSHMILDPENILFFNGLGDAISKVYSLLQGHARILGPSPAYPTHSSAEAAHAGSFHLTYKLNPANGWLPDMEDLRNKINYNPQIAGILIINPDNPTGMVYPCKVLEEIVNLAKRYRLFLIADEIYARLAYGPEPFVSLAEVTGDVPAVVMRGLSKEMPWPGARCGWIEVYNLDRDRNFARYIKSLGDAKMLEVCSTTLPQAVLPTILGDERYTAYLGTRRQHYAKRAREAAERLIRIPGIEVVRPSGAFYLTVTFKPGELVSNQKLPIDKPAARKLVEEAVAGVSLKELDKRFCYYLMGSQGLCVVPLTGFNSVLSGFRMTLLETSDEKFDQILTILERAIPEYLASNKIPETSNKQEVA